MSDQEFDNYLTLLSRLLRLGAKQRDAIAGELRSHLEDRLEELLARGVPRDEAVRQALEEFGDAAGLAAEFVSLKRHKRNRWIMRFTTASVAAVVLIATGIITFWPGNNAGPGAAKLVAQAQAEQSKADPTGDEKAAGEHKATAIKDVLDRRAAFSFKDVPLKEVAKQLGAQNGITIYLAAKHLQEAGVNLDTPVTQEFRDIRFRKFLELMLSELELTYVVEEDGLLITTPERAAIRMIVRVYDCRELLALPRPTGSVRSVVPGDVASAAGSEASGRAGVPEQIKVSDSENLIDLITTIVAAETWRSVGGPCAIVDYRGLLTVSTTHDTHEEVERLLNMLHEAAELKNLKVTVVE